MRKTKTRMWKNIVYLILAGLICSCSGIACTQHPPEDSQGPMPATIIPTPSPQLPNVVPTNPYSKPAEREVVQLPPRPPDTFVEEVLPIHLPGDVTDSQEETPADIQTPDSEDSSELDNLFEDGMSDETGDSLDGLFEDNTSGETGELDNETLRKFVYRTRYQPSAVLKTLLDEAYMNDFPTPTFIANMSDMGMSEWSDLNELLIVATRMQYAEIRSLLNKLDHPPLQVYLDMWIGEVNLQDNETLGTTLTALFQGQVDAGSANLPFEGASWTRFNEVVTTSEGLTYAVGSQGNFAMLFNMLASENRLRVLSDPHLFVRHNKTATIEVGERVPVREIQVEDNIRTETIRTEDVKLTLSVTPQINYDGTILVKIEQVIDEVGERDYGGTGAPSVRTRSASTELLLHDGLTVLMGGLISLRDERVTKGVPLAKDIPLVGRLFRSTTNIIVDRELILLITPHIMWTSEHEMVYTGVMNDYTRKWKDQEYFVEPDSQRVREFLNIMPPDEEKGQ